MQTDFIEIQSALWQKIFASVVALPFIGLGLVCCASPFLPLINGPAPHPVVAIALGLFFGGGPLMVRAIQVSLKERRLLREAKARENGEN